MKYLSVCSGIEAATVAWHPLGWKPLAFSEIEKFPSQVLEHHYPDVPNYGDMTKFKEWSLDAIDLLVGGTPCQSFSVAGLRKGLEDPRGNLMLTYCGILDWFRPKWFVWENVPGVLSSGGGRDFGSFFGALAELGYGFAYRVLDAQYFGVAQRRRRVFVVGHFGDWRPAAEVLFEPESLRGNPAPRREAGKGFARTSGTLTANGGGLNRPAGNANELDFCIPTTFDRKNIGVRRLTPIECERLQGFPDNYTDIKPTGKETPDGPRYKALGNSMAVPVMAWIGKRIAGYQSCH
jgi:DNA (cytosine-5)-methyltransferase 1